MVRRTRTVLELAAEADLDLDDTLVALWDIGIESVNGRTDSIPDRHINAAREALGLTNPRDSFSVDYWISRSGLDRKEMATKLLEFGIELSPTARKIPKHSLRIFKNLFDHSVIIPQFISTTPPQGSPNIPLLGLDHDRVLFGRYALPVMSRYIDQRGGRLNDAAERDRLLCWYFQSAMWGRFSGSTETILDVDFEAIEDLEHGIDRLFEQLRLWHGSLRVEPGHFRGWSLGARFYPVLYALTRTGDAKDWGTGLALKSSLHGKMSALEVRHIFPKAHLYGHKPKFRRPEVNAIANFCLLTKDTNLQIGTKPPSKYFPDVEDRQPGALASQWIPMDRELWKTENYLQFLDERQRLLASAANELLEGLLHGVLAAEILDDGQVSVPESASIPGGIEDPAEEEALNAINRGLGGLGLPEGHKELELSHPATGEPLAILDLAWPNGLQEGFSEPVALLLDEGQETLQIANDHGFRHFTSVDSFKRYVECDVVAMAQ